MPKAEYKNISSQLDRHFKLVTWAKENLLPGTNVKFKGSRSNRRRGQYRQILHIDDTNQMTYKLFGRDATIGSFETDGIDTLYIVSKNIMPGDDPNYIGVVATNALEFLQSVEINGKWTSMTDIEFPVISRPLVSVYIMPPGVHWLSKDKQTVVFK